MVTKKKLYNRPYYNLVLTDRQVADCCKLRGIDLEKPNAFLPLFAPSKTLTIVPSAVGNLCAVPSVANMGVGKSSQRAQGRASRHRKERPFHIVGHIAVYACAQQVSGSSGVIGCLRGDCRV